MKKVRKNINPQSWSEFPAGELQRQYDRTDRMDIYKNIKHLIEKEDTILDLAIGGGREIRILRDEGYENIVDACDYFQEVLDFIKTKDLKIRRLYQQDVRKDLGEDKYDIVIATEIIEHLDDPIDFIKRALAKANKYLIITTPERDTGQFEQHVWSFEKEDLEVFGGTVERILINNSPHLLGVYENSNRAASR